MFSMKRSVLMFVAVLLTAGLVSGSAQAADAPVLERIVQSGKLKVGLSGDQPPLNAKGRDGQLMGLEIDLANLLAGAFRVEAEFVTRPFPQLLDALAAGEVDIVMSGLAITANRSLKASFAGPYMLSGKSILTNSTALAAAKEAGEINRAELKLAALANSTSEEFVQKVLPEATLVSGFFTMFRGDPWTRLRGITEAVDTWVETVGLRAGRPSLEITDTLVDK